MNERKNLKQNCILFHIVIVLPGARAFIAVGGTNEQRVRNAAHVGCRFNRLQIKYVIYNIIQMRQRNSNSRAFSLSVFVYLFRYCSSFSFFFYRPDVLAHLHPNRSNRGS